jgi:hypothetical protein
MSWPAVVLWVLLAPLMLLRGPALLYATLIVNVFMSLQMLPGDGGGANLLPVTIYAAALILKVALAPGNVMRGLEAALDIRRLGLFTAFILYSLLGALILPRMFAGLVEVIPVSGAGLDGPSLVQPRSGNITQPCYMVVSYMTALAFAVIGSREDVRRNYLRALLCGALALFVTGLADLVSSRLGLSGLLDPFRTASYELLTDVETDGVKRVVGLTPEASAFGSLCVSSAAALLLLRPLYRPGWERALATLALIGVAAMALLSTSATAYVGGAVLAMVYFVNLCGRALRPRTIGRETVGVEGALLLTGAFAAIVAIAFAPKLVAPLFELVDKIIFQKSASLSYYQRNLWTQIGIDAFFDSGGLGVGLGSVRTSNWVVSILASTGVIGGALMFGFVLQKLASSVRKDPPEVACLKEGLKLWLLPTLVMSLIGGTIPDIGVMMAMVLGMLSIEMGPAKEAPPVVIKKRRPEVILAR